jgi:hypothetical protein
MGGIGERKNRGKKFFSSAFADYRSAFLHASMSQDFGALALHMDAGENIYMLIRDAHNIWRLRGRRISWRAPAPDMKESNAVRESGHSYDNILPKPFPSRLAGLSAGFGIFPDNAHQALAVRHVAWGRNRFPAIAGRFFHGLVV